MGDDGILEYRAARDIVQGEELLVEYGRQQKDNTQTLLDYGFRRVDGFEYAVVDLDVNASEPSARKRLDVFEQYAGKDDKELRLGETHFVVTGQRFPHTLLRAVRLLAATDRELGDTESLKRVFNQSQPLSLENEKIAIPSMCAIFRRRLDEFATPLSQDLEILEAETFSSNVHRLAVQQRAAEKVVLARALDACNRISEQVAKLQPPPVPPKKQEQKDTKDEL